MPNQPSLFWESFYKKDFNTAQTELSALEITEQKAVLEELFQKSGYHRMPILVSVLRRTLHASESFDDFYQAWFPSEDMCNNTEAKGKIFQQHFPLPVRVLNAANINNPREIISIGITWVSNKDEEKSLFEYLKQASAGKDNNNEIRKERIEKVADSELLGLFRVEADDNLGVPF